MAKVPAAEQVQVNFRMPAALRDRIKAIAEANNRSMNAEIVAALEEKFPDTSDGLVRRSDYVLRQILYISDLLIGGGVSHEERNKLIKQMDERKRELNAIQKELIDRSIPAPAVSQRRLYPWEIEKIEKPE